MVRSIRRKVKITGPMNCAQCGRSFTLCAGLVHHLLSHNPQKSGCAQCGQTFVRKRSLQLHLTVIHNRQVKVDNERPFQCDICGNGYRTHKSLLFHEIIHKPRQFKCSKCDAEFGKPRHLEKHLLVIHQFIEPTVLDCNVCGKHLLNRNSLAHHLQFHSAPQLSCNKCDKKFVAAYLLEGHMKNFHNPEWTSSRNPDSYTCAICYRPFYRMIKLVRHLNGHYPLRTIFPLGRKLVSKSNFLRVEEAESIKSEVQVAFQNIKPDFICATCGKSFVQKHDLQMHILVHTTAQLSCSVCAKLYKRIDSLRTHLRKKHSISKKRHKPNCKICGTKCKNAAALACHNRYRHEVAKFICDHCGIKIFTLPNLVKHIQSAHSVKWKITNVNDVNCRLHTYICSICCQPFGVRKDGLITHLRMHYR